MAPAPDSSDPGCSAGSPHHPDATPLHAVTFVIVDLETTGGSPSGSRITEIGAVKVQGGEVLGEFATLIDPGVPIPPGISALTGITDAMVSPFPPVEAVLPTFLEFAYGSVLVAHNARFDTGFLNANLERLDYPRLRHPVVCTAALARRLLRDELRDCRLSTLARHFRCRTRPLHRALADARATVEVLHALLELAGSFGVQSREDLLEFAKVRNLALYKARKPLADGLPHAPGVYAFRSEPGEVLYVGKATDLKARVRGYFGGDSRRRIDDLLREAATIDHWETPTAIEAAVTELRLIAANRPRYNRRSKLPPPAVWLKLTAERFPRLSVVRSVRDDGGTYLGPLPSRRVAERIAEAILDVVPLRRCTLRIGPRTRVAACALAEMGRCIAPCDGRVDPGGYAPTAEAVAGVLAGDATLVIARSSQRLQSLAESGRYEEAGATRDRLHALVTALARCRRLEVLTAPGSLVVSRPGRSTDTREVIVVRSGRLVASAVCAASDAGDVAEGLAHTAPAAAPVTIAPVAAGAAGSAEEIDLVARWLEGTGAHVHACDGRLASTVTGGRLLRDEAARLTAGTRRTGRARDELAAKRLRRGGPGE